MLCVHQWTKAAVFSCQVRYIPSMFYFISLIFYPRLYCSSQRNVLLNVVSCTVNLNCISQHGIVLLRRTLTYLQFQFYELLFTLCIWNVFARKYDSHYWSSNCCSVMICLSEVEQFNLEQFSILHTINNVKI